MKRLVVVLRQPTRAPGIKMTGITTRATGWWEEGGAICWTASQQHITRSLFWILKIPVLSFYRLYFVDRFISPRFISPIITKALFILKWKFVIFVILAYFTNFWTNKLRNFRYLKGKTKKKLIKFGAGSVSQLRLFLKSFMLRNRILDIPRQRLFAKILDFFILLHFCLQIFRCCARIWRAARATGGVSHVPCRGMFYVHWRKIHVYPGYDFLSEIERCMENLPASTPPPYVIGAKFLSTLC